MHVETASDLPSFLEINPFPAIVAAVRVHLNAAQETPLQELVLGMYRLYYGRCAHDEAYARAACETLRADQSQVPLWFVRPFIVP